MIESKLNIPENTVVGFPRFYTNMKEDFTVMFSDYRKGVVVSSSISSIPIGKQRTDWIHCKDEDEWKLLPKGTTITLTQK